MGKTIIISEGTRAFLKEEMEMTEYKFKGSLKRFLHDLLQDPVTAEPGNVLTLNGLTRAKLIKLLVRKGILEKHMTIVDKNSDGEPMEAKMKITFKVPKQDYERKIKRLYIELFEKNVPPKKSVNENVTIFQPNEIDRIVGDTKDERTSEIDDEKYDVTVDDELQTPVAEIEECCAGGACGGAVGDGTGATTGSGVYADNPSGVGFLQPMADVQRRDIYGFKRKKKKKK